MGELDAVFRELHACPVGLTCRPGRGILYPKPPEGKAAPGGTDILLLGWNPRIQKYPRERLPDLPTYEADAAAGLARDPGETAALLPALPATHRLDSGRVMRTHLWKWPTRFKTSEGESAFYAQRCMANHFERELAALRPRVLVTFHTEAAAEMARRAEALGVELRAPSPAVRASEARAWSLGAPAWGWPMGLVLVHDAPDGGYDANTLAWTRKAIAHLLGTVPR